GEQADVRGRQLILQEGEELEVELLLGSERRPAAGDPIPAIRLRRVPRGFGCVSRPRIALVRSGVVVAQRDGVELPISPLPLEEEAPQDIVGEEGAELDAVTALERPHAGEDPVALEDVDV